MWLTNQLKELDSGMQEHVRAEKHNAVRIAGAACTANFLLGTGKLLIGIFSLSPFAVINALYTYGMVAAKFCALKSIAVPPRKQYAYYRRAAGILIAASLCYAAYSTRLFWHVQSARYHPYLSMGIATITFTEIGLNLWGIFVERKKRSLPFHALKIISLASSLIGLVLTQTALLSFTHTDAGYTSACSDGILGLCMSGSSVLLGLFMLWRAAKLESKEEII